MDVTCQVNLDMQALEDRQRELEDAWNALLIERRDYEARVSLLEQREQQFKLKWDLLIAETQKLADDKTQFQRRQDFFARVEQHYEMETSRDDNIIHGEMFFNGVSDAKSLKKRYKDLIKIYHPDSESGDKETVAEINREYDNLKQNLL
ncbi:MAG: molecular chaperone DnaJ [Pseudobutyrivibrio sp.]|nr:molecular chaperone DnaJ [Pseudobutyrivibrio sp.]